MAKIGALVLIAASPLIAVPAAAAPPATPALAAAATPELVIAQVTNENPPYGDIIATGTFTCSEPSGEATLSMVTIQIPEVGTPIVILTSTETVQCGSGPVPYAIDIIVTLPGAFFLNGFLFRNGVQEVATAGGYFDV